MEKVVIFHSNLIPSLMLSCCAREYLPILLESLSGDAVRRLIAEVAAYQHEMFSLRFEQAGFLYHSLHLTNSVGPIISTSFYRAPDGFVRIDDAALLPALGRLRGPFSTVSDYL